MTFEQFRIVMLNNKTVAEHMEFCLERGILGPASERRDIALHGLDLARDADICLADNHEHAMRLVDELEAALDRTNHESDRAAHEAGR